MSLKIFTEAGYEKGFGHFTRMSCICEAFIRNKKDVQMFLDADEVAEKLLARKFVYCCQWNDTDVIKNHISSEDVVIVDSYYVNMKFLHAVQNMCRELIVIDDNCRLDYENMIIINPNYFGEYLSYPDNKGNEYYVGKDYTLLREPFQFNGDRIVRQDVEEVLITFGGTDVTDLTEQVIKTIKTIDYRVKLNVVVTNAFKRIKEIEKLLDKNDVLVREASAEEMSGLMKSVDFAVASAGGTSNELIKMQCPSFLIGIADNQKLNLKYLSEHKLIRCGSAEDPEKLKAMFRYDTRKRLVSELAKKQSNVNAVTLIERIADQWKSEQGS